MNIHHLIQSLASLDAAEIATVNENHRSMILFIKLLIRMQLQEYGIFIGGVVPNRQDVIGAMSILHSKFGLQIMSDKSKAGVGAPDARADELTIAMRHITCSAVLVEMTEQELLKMSGAFNVNG